MNTSILFKKCYCIWRHRAKSNAYHPNVGVFRIPSLSSQIYATHHPHHHLFHAACLPKYIGQTVGTWIVNEVSSPEVEELMMAFEAMSTIVKFANITLGSGNVEVAKQNYVEALVLFKKLGNDRGVRGRATCVSW